MRRILLSILVIAAVAGATIKLSSAFFSDTETSTENIFSSGSLDLKVDELDNPTAIVEFTNLKPGDQYPEQKTLRVLDNDAYVWMHIKDIQTSQGTATEPESTEENGTPKYDINNYLTYSLTVGGNQIIASPININDAVSCWIPLGQVTGGELVNMSQVFNFDPSVTNWAQGDTMTFAEEFYAEQSANNPSPSGPVSLTGRVWDGTKCIDELELIESLSVPANLTTPVSSSLIAENGDIYRIKAVGTAEAGDTIVFDAEYSLTNKVPGDTWSDDVTGYESDGPNLLDLMINESFVNWGAFNMDHIYWYETTGNGNPFTFRVNDTFPSNNQGEINVEIYKVN